MTGLVSGGVTPREEEGPVGRRLRSGLQHLRQGQFQHRQQAHSVHQVHQRLPEHRQDAHSDRGQQAGPPPQADGAERGGLDAGSQDRLPLLRGVGGRELPQRAHGVSRAGGQDEGRQADDEEASGLQGHCEEHVRGVRKETDRLLLAETTTEEEGDFYESAEERSHITLV